MLAAARELDESQCKGDNRRRRPMLAVLTLASLRIGELLNLRWRDVNLATRKLRVKEAKTDAGVREVDLTPEPREILAHYRAHSVHDDGDDFIHDSQRWSDSDDNIGAVKLANEELHKLAGPRWATSRRTLVEVGFISLLLAAGADVPYVMAQAGHSDSR